MRILITGTAGFIGNALAYELLNKEYKVAGIDNLNDYYSVELKQARLSRIITHSNYQHNQVDLEDVENINKIFHEFKPDIVVNLAAQAGVRYSIENPSAYVSSNIMGFTSVLEASKKNNVKHLVYASTSSVYGLNTNFPFSTDKPADHPVSFYAATKRANELMAHSYSSLFNLPTTGIRFFTVYGPWGRPDMALFKFVKNILENNPIEVFNFGKHKRDFTYIDDLVKGIEKIMFKFPDSDKDWNSENPRLSSSQSPWKIYNIGNNAPTNLMDYIKAIEQYLGLEAKKDFLPLQIGDVESTHADVSDLVEELDYRPTTSIEEGVKKFIDWYLDFYEIK